MAKNKQLTASNAAPPGAPSKAFAQALRRLLRPLVRLLLHFQITFPYLAELIKSIYVEVAEQDFALAGKKQTDSRLSVLTGIHRKDIKRLRKALIEGDVEPETVNLGTSVISQWVSDPRFSDTNGRPNALPLKNSPDTFEALVQSVFKQDVGARSLLDEWLRLGIVEIIEEPVQGQGSTEEDIEGDIEKVQLNMQAFIPKAGSDEQAFFLGMNIADHLSAIEHNLVSEDKPYFERCVYYEGLNEQDILQLEKLVAEEGMNTLKKINKKAQQLKKKHQGTGDYRFNSGVYLFHESSSAPTLESEQTDKKGK